MNTLPKSKKTELAATVPQAGQLKIEDFIDRSLISELESEGFISKIDEGR
jgi:hypothetical protein